MVARLRRRFRRLVLRLWGPPVCRNCWHMQDPPRCISRCGRTDAERIATYLDGRHTWDDA